MKKYVVVVAVAVLVALAAPAALAATNPFMDVPINHWAYDAIGQLAARGVLSGYPDGTYKGKQPTTRYEMASALARALALVDMTKASKQDVEMLKKLVVEFKDELDALGVRVDDIDERLSLIESRLGGWKLSGNLRLDIDYWDIDDGVDDDVAAPSVSHARLFFDRWFGEDEEMHFFARLDSDGGKPTSFNRFYVEFPVWGDVMLTVGRFSWNFEGAYNFATGGTTDLSNGAWLTDNTYDGFGLSKSFSMGTVKAYLNKPSVQLFGDDADDSIAAWELAAVAELQFTEQFGFDLGFQAFVGDDLSKWSDASLVDGTEYEFSFNNLYTIFAGLRFNFNDNIALKGLYYYQQGDVEYTVGTETYDLDWDSSSAFKVAIDVSQDLLKFTSLWLGYDYLEAGFLIPDGTDNLWLNDTGNWNGKEVWGVIGTDTSIWRVGATQQWNDKWRTWLYVSQITQDDAYVADNGLWYDAKATQYGLGVDYQYNANIGFALNYIHVDWKDDVRPDASFLRFRTEVNF